MSSVAAAASRLAVVVEPISDAVQQATRTAIAGLPQSVRNLVDGVWLGTPLHPPLTDVPIGASAAAVMIDAARAGGADDTLDVAAEAALGVAVLGALPAAATGLNDWSYLRGEGKRIGAVHAVLNSVALVLNCASLVARRRGDKRRGRLLSSLGFGLTTVAAHLGGELSFGLGIRVNRTAFERGGDEFVAVLEESELPADGVRGATVDGVDVVLSRAGGRVCAIAATCTHLGGPLAKGERRGDSIVCPWHGSRFDLCTGEVIDGPAVYPQPVYDTRVEAGRIEVRRRPAS